MHVQVQRQSRGQLYCLEVESPLQIFQHEYTVKRTGRTLCYGSSEDFNHAYSDPGFFITKCTYKCGDGLGVKYLVPKARCDYYSMNIP